MSEMINYDHTIKNYPLYLGAVLNVSSKTLCLPRPLRQENFC